MGTIKAIGGGLLLLIVAIAIFSGGDDEDESAAPASASAEAVGESAGSDTGRMSSGEYETFQSAQADVVDESLQFSEGIQKCAVIGQTGDLVGFSDCMDEAYDGFEDKAGYADFIAEDTLDDTAKKCQGALRSYRIVLDDLTGAASRLHQAGSLLQFDELTSASQDLPRASKRYVKFATNALAACEPR